MALSDSQKKRLRGLGHELKPVVMIGDAGATEAVLAEFETALDHHELIKVSVRAGDRSMRNAIIDRLIADSDAELVQRIGNVALIYRRNPDRQRVRLSADEAHS